MLRSKPFSRDPLTGKVSRIWHYDDVTDEAIIEDVVDVQAYGEYNREMAKANVGRFADGLHWIGSMPMPIYWRLKQRGVFDDSKSFRKWWLSEEALPFRGRDMRV